MKTAAIIISILFLSAPLYSTMIIDEKSARIRIYESQNEFPGHGALVKGKIISFSSRDKIEKDELNQSKAIKTQATVRLYDREGIEKGTTLFIVNDNNLVVAKMTVKVITHTKTFGYLAVGYGNMLLASEGNRAVLKWSGDYTRYAHVHKARGDYYRESDDVSKSIGEYKKAISLDSANPSAHLELGNIYFSQGVYNFAFREFTEAYRNIARLYDNEDRYHLLKGLAEIRFREIFYSPLPNKVRNQYREEGIKYAREALRVYPGSVEVNFIIGMFFYKNPEDHDTEARDHFLKVVDVDPEHIDANIALAELYLKHRNKPKARKYAEAARKIDPGNKRARELMKYIDNYKVE